MSGLLRFFETLFRRHFWVVMLAGITLVSLLTALGINGIIAAQLAPFAVVVPVIEPAVTEEDDGEEDNNALAISHLLELPPEPTEEVAETEPEPEPEAEPEEEAPPAFGDCVQSSIPVVLVGTMLDPRGDWSLALVQDQTASRTILVSTGMEVGGAQVVGITRTPQRVFVEHEGRTECLKPGAQPGAQAATETPGAGGSEAETPSTTETPERTSEPQASTPGNYGSASDLRSAVRRTSPTTYEIDRAAIQAVMDNPRMVQSQAPEFQQSFADGRPSGIRLTTIPSGSIFSAIGIRQGDVIQEVNGNRVTTPQRAMELYDALQTESHVEIIVERRGRQRTLTYDIH